MRVTATGVSRRLKALTQWVFPPVCVQTGTPTRSLDLSAPLWAEMAKQTEQRFCSRCALPVAPSAPSEVCGACLQRPPPYEHTRAAFRYQDLARDWVQAMKYGPDMSYAEVMAQCWYRRLGAMQAPVAEPVYLIPVPLHPDRLRERGFNQSLELAKRLAALNGTHQWVVCADWVRRVQPTSPQASLSAKARQDNLKQAFQLTAQGREHLAMLKQGTVVMVDDVMTTGSTLFSLGQRLRQPNPRLRLEAWVFARANVN
ncbi:hypothetical protein AVO41_02145 [Thiomicrospira sp. WB1]|nr:hypothetical protein AVO41_02145 [Thiomicrospira sp. WB1]